jgi:hypothetical protein
VCRFIAAVTAADDRVAKLVFGEALAVGALEGVGRTAVFPGGLTVVLVFARRTVLDAVAATRSRHASPRRLAFEGFDRTFVPEAFFVGAVAAVFAAVADEEPADASTGAAALQQWGWGFDCVLVMLLGAR